jgi:hypothetical protein
MKFGFWILDFDRCSSLEGTKDVETYLASVLARNDLTVPKARETDEGYKCFKAGYIKAAQRYGSNSKRICCRVLRTLEEQMEEREKHSLERSPGSRRRDVEWSRGSDNPNWRERKYI